MDTKTTDFIERVGLALEAVGRARLARWQRFHEAIGEARSTLPIRSRKVRARLEDFETAYMFLANAIRDALAHLPAARNARSAMVGIRR